MSRVASFHLVSERHARALLSLPRLATDRRRLHTVDGLAFVRLLGTARGARTATSIDQLRQRTVEQSYDAVRSINVLTSQIADIDAEILGAVNIDADPNALLDQRDHKVAELGELADIRVIEQDNGQVTISLDGQLLVSNGAATALTVETQPDANLGALGYDRIAVLTPTGRELRVNTGQLAADLNAVMQTIPDGRRDLDAVVAREGIELQRITEVVPGKGRDGFAAGYLDVE